MQREIEKTDETVNNKAAAPCGREFPAHRARPLFFFFKTCYTKNTLSKAPRLITNHGNQAPKAIFPLPKPTAG